MAQFAGHGATEIPCRSAGDMDAPLARFLRLPRTLFAVRAFFMDFILAAPPPLAGDCGAE